MQIEFKASKHVSLTILIKVPMIIAQSVSAASNPEIQGLNLDCPLDHYLNSNLSKAVQLIAYFNADLHHAIPSNELYTFREVPPLYTKPTAAVTPKNDHKNVNVNEPVIMSRTGRGTHVETHRW